MNYFDRFLSALSHLNRRIRTAAITTLALLALAAPAIAQDTNSTGTTTMSTGTGGLNPSGTVTSASTSSRRAARKPFRAARLTYIEGDVRVEQANSTANSVAAINMPLVEGTVISSGSDGQAEIEFEDGSVARLTPNSGLSLANLSVDSSGNYQSRLVLLGGLVYLELRGGTKYLYTVDAGGDVISPVENTTIRVNFDQPPASVAVLDGTAHFATAGKSFTDATAGQTVQADPSDGSVLLVKSTIAPETWDRWNEDRDETAASEAGSETDARTKFAGNQGYGWSDLDANGSWYDVPGHGEVWQPDIAAAPDEEAAGEDQTADNSGFDPYGYGSWAYTPAGYSWASGYGWGWLPYRCGLWSFYPGFGWGWSPNTYCGVYGFAGYGYGYGYDGGLNFGSVPPRYRRPGRPIPGPGPIHPILRGRGGPVPVAPAHRPGADLGGDRMIAGNTVHPLPPVGSGFTVNTGGSLGAALRRDYPVDTKTHAPITGVISASRSIPVAGSNIRAAWNPAGQAGGPARGSYSPQRTAPSPAYDGGSRTAPAYHPAPAPAQRQSAPPAQRSSPPPASHSAPATSSSSSPKGK